MPRARRRPLTIPTTATTTATTPSRGTKRPSTPRTALQVPARVPNTGGCCASCPSASRACASDSRPRAADLVPLGEGHGEVGLRRCKWRTREPRSARPWIGRGGRGHGSDGRRARRSRLRRRRAGCRRRPGPAGRRRCRHVGALQQRQQEQQGRQALDDDEAPVGGVDEQRGVPQEVQRPGRGEARRRRSARAGGPSHGSGRTRGRGREAGVHGVGPQPAHDAAQQEHLAEAAAGSWPTAITFAV